MKKLIVTIASLLALAACGGTDSNPSNPPPPPVCTYEIAVSPWGPCVNGVQSREVVSLTESILGCAPDPILVQACVLACPPQAPLTCVTPIVTMCCPTGTPYYCQGLNVCLSVGNGAGCGGFLPFACW
jgi:hypothetical protein